MDTLDAFQAATELDLMLTYLRFHRCDHRFQPGFRITVGALESAPDLYGDFIEEFLRDPALVVGQQQDGRIQMGVAPLIQTVDFLQITA